MEELIAQVTQKANIPAEQARSAVNTVLSFLKGKLPAALGGQIDSALSGGESGGAAAVTKGLGGLLGK